MKKNPQVDAYITSAAPFARPILKHLRKLVHQACPAGVEVMKWGMPHFDYLGMMCGMAAFKQHCALNFWKHQLLLQDTPAQTAVQTAAMGQFGRITSLADLPDDQTLLALLRRAVVLNDSGTRVGKPRSPRKPPPKAPPDLAAALKKNPRAKKTYDAFSNTNRREYVEWITEARTGATRGKRLATAVEWMGEGKTRNWKYVNC